MSGLNIILGFLVAVAGLGGALDRLLRNRAAPWTFLAELSAAFALATSRLEVQTVAEVGMWAGGLGPDVALTVLFAVLLAHGAVCTGATGNPAVTVTRLLLDDGTAAAAALGVAGQILGAHLGLVVARRYWALEMTDLHVIKALMGAECSTALRSSPAQGFCVEAACGATFTLLHLGLRRKPALLRVPALAATLTFLSHAARNYTSGVANPALAYALTFRCSGFSFTQYALVYWLGTLAGATLAVFLYVGHVPRLFSKNLLYSRKGRVRGPRGRSCR